MTGSPKKFRFVYTATKGCATAGIQPTAKLPCTSDQMNFGPACVLLPNAMSRATSGSFTKRAPIWNGTGIWRSVPGSTSWRVTQEAFS